MNRCDNCGDPVTCSCTGLPVSSVLIDQIDLMRDEFQRIASCPGVTSEITDICWRALAAIKQAVPVIVQRDNAVHEMEACHRCWDDFTAKISTVIPQAENWPLFSQADAIVKRVEALQRIRDYPVHSEPVGGAMAMQDIAGEALKS